MSAPDTSAEAVERVAQLLDEVAEPLRWDCATRNEAAALLRALVAERDRMDKALMREAEGERAAYARGFREGAEQMREAAAGRMHRIAENERATKPYAQNDDHVMRIEDTAFALDQHGRAIRALPLPEPQA